MYKKNVEIFAARHARTPLNDALKINGEIDEPLSTEGVQQAYDFIDYVPSSIRYIYTSPLLRAIATTDIINTNVQASITVVSELTEIRMGSLAGYGWSEMPSGAELKHRHRSMTFDYSPYGGETVKQVETRVLSFFREISKKHANGEVLLVTHGGIIRFIHLLATGEPLMDDLKNMIILTYNLDSILKDL